MDTSGNMNHAIIITECWIYDSNYKIASPLLKQSLDIIFSPTKYDKFMYAKYEAFL